MPIPKPRYSVKENTPESFMVIDEEAATANNMAVTLFLRKPAALTITDLLNAEWEAWKRRPW